MFGDDCKKKHFKETCNDKECIRSACPKKDPRFCYFKFTFGNCKFWKSIRYMYDTPGFAQSTPIVNAIRDILEEVDILKIEIKSVQ